MTDAHGTTDGWAASAGAAVQTPIIAIDGPAGSGKSSVSKEIARRRGYGYLDTGAGYRALSWHVLDLGADTTDPDAVLDALTSFDLRLGLQPDDRTVTVRGVDVTAEIRTPEVTAAIAGFTRVPEVRAYLNGVFRRLAGESGLAGVVIEGRDITSVVAPDAPVRILMTASPEVRAARRGLELGSDTGTVAEAMRIRDESDSHVLDLALADPGVDVIDSTELDFEQTIDAVLTVIDRKINPKQGGRNGR
ncbi:(d)CMP kinase [Microbacterium album]|uniref:Cytidylate kinase n=1 Tax=Microbacterium album TaxID=2053191 RepID=A0A917IFR7_9MICO|nr:(d)CMP kinase [Microbacterium album]GGH46018.1 cytidylate kinase [Microbacterium album]